MTVNASVKQLDPIAPARGADQRVGRPGDETPEEEFRHELDRVTAKPTPDRRSGEKTDAARDEERDARRDESEVDPEGVEAPVGVELARVTAVPDLLLVARTTAGRPDASGGPLDDAGPVAAKTSTDGARPASARGRGAAGSTGGASDPAGAARGSTDPGPETPVHRDATPDAGRSTSGATGREGTDPIDARRRSAADAGDGREPVRAARSAEFAPDAERVLDPEARRMDEVRSRAASLARDGFDPRHLDEGLRARLGGEASSRRETAELREQERQEERSASRRATARSNGEPSERPAEAPRPDGAAPRPAPAASGPTGDARPPQSGPLGPEPPGTTTSKTGPTAVPQAAAADAGPAPAPATPTAAVTPNLAAGAPVPLDTVLRQVRLQVRPGVHDLKIMLDPPELGRLNLRFVMRGESLHVTVRASSTEVVNALKNDLAAFEQTLRDAGVDLSSLDIDLDGGHDRRTAGTAADGRDGAGTSPGSASDPDDAAPTEEQNDSEPLERPTPRDDSRIDVTV